MILILMGPPGIGKSTLAQNICAKVPGAVHLQFDTYRATLGDTRTNPAIEDAINWRIYVAAIDKLREVPEPLVILDSMGISKRLPYLRQALRDYQQVAIKLISAFPYMMCTNKWGNLYTQEQCDHIVKMVMELRSDYNLRVDNRQDQLADEVISWLKSSSSNGGPSWSLEQPKSKYRQGITFS